ncbi:MAG: ADP-forming succinate--CoA ligase subunit beta [Candidatus Thermoplasmatota archaeon]|nr:ADP-forming succinate--CoA ligase subunit beta [Candidatus Thermoplasmatota archaeon]
MKFYEYRAKEVFQRYGIPVPKGLLVVSSEEVVSPPLPAAVKAQVLVGGRMKAGGIAFAESLKEARRATSRILGMEIGGYGVKKVLLEERLEIERELYLSMTLDRSARTALLMASPDGGIDIEQVPGERIFRSPIPPLVGIQPYILRGLKEAMGLPKELGRSLSAIAEALYRLFKGEDAELVEINPLVVTRGGGLVAGDAKLILEDNALYRHPEYQGMEQDLTVLEREANQKGIAFIELGGNIGVIANGAGLTMATMDALHVHGGRPGVFLDLGGTDDPETVKEAFLLMMKARPRVILLNIFGGITKCDTVALGVQEASEVAGAEIPIIVRIRGVNEERAREILREAGMTAVLDMGEAAKAAVQQAGE